MKTILGGAMRKAAALTSRQNLAEATKVIQLALSGAVRGGRAEAARADAPKELKPELPKTTALRGGFAPSSAPTQPKPAAPPAAFLEVVQDAVQEVVQEVAKQGARKAPPMGEVLHLLQKGFVPVRAPGFGPHVRPAPEVPTPPGAQFLLNAYANGAGARDYMLYVPSDAKRRAEARGLPLIVMLHGCTQNPEDFALGTGMNQLAEKHGCLVAYPKQPTSSNNMACWNWFSPKDQARDLGEAGIIAGIVREIMAEHAVDPDRVFVAGLSAGGGHGGDFWRRPTLIFSPRLEFTQGCPTERRMMSDRRSPQCARAPAARRSLAVDEALRTIVFHGEADRTVHPVNGELIVAAARAALPAATEQTIQGRSAGGVAYKRTVIAGKRGAPHVEHWSLEGVGHAWSGGIPRVLHQSAWPRRFA